MNKFWSIVFGVTMGACGLLFIIAPLTGWWLPEGVSKHSGAVDDLFYLILWVTGFFFFLTEAILVGFMFCYSSDGGIKPARSRGFPGLLKPLESVLHDAHRIEMAWTLVPALILIVIAFVQVDTWAEVKYQWRMPDLGNKDGNAFVPTTVDVSARQFEWRIRYPHPARIKKWREGARTADADTRKDYESFHRTKQFDDVDDVNALHVWKGNPTVVYLTTRDVIHSFNIPMMRVKQDALPGKVIPVWFVPIKANTALNEKTGEYVDRVKYDDKGNIVERDDRASRWDIPCAELCGWGHYRMIGRVYVHNTEAEFMDWLEKQDQRAHATRGPR